MWTGQGARVNVKRFSAGAVSEIAFGAGRRLANLRRGQAHVAGDVVVFVGSEPGGELYRSDNGLATQLTFDLSNSIWGRKPRTDGRLIAYTKTFGGSQPNQGHGVALHSTLR